MAVEITMAGTWAYYCCEKYKLQSLGSNYCHSASLTHQNSHFVTFLDVTFWSAAWKGWVRTSSNLFWNKGAMWQMQRNKRMWTQIRLEDSFRVILHSVAQKYNNEMQYNSPAINISFLRFTHVWFNSVLWCTEADLLLDCIKCWHLSNILSVIYIWKNRKYKKPLII